MIRLIENRQMLSILVMFLIVQFGGMLIASLLFTTTPISAITSSTVASSTTSVLFYFLYIIAGALVILLIVRYLNGDLVFRLIEAVVIISASFFIFFIILGYVAPQNTDPNYVYAGALLLSVALVVAKNVRPHLRNLATIIASMGVGVVLGLGFGFIPSLIFMGLIAIYDYVAVFITKHMITLAKAISSRNLAFLIGSTDVETVPASYLSKKERSEYRKFVRENKLHKNEIFRKAMESGKIAVVSQVQLGAGDLGLPLMVAVSAYLAYFNYTASIVIVCGAAAGLVATMYFLRKYQRALPAIPPIFSFILFAYSLFLIFAEGMILLPIALIILGILTMSFGIILTLRRKSWM